MAEQVTTTTQANPAATQWTPNPDDPITHIQIGDDHFHIHTDDLPEAQRRSPDLKVVKVVRQDPMLSAFQSMAQQSDSLPSARKASPGDPMLAAFTALKDNPDDDPAKRPGAYQQTKEQAQAGIVHNVNEDAANPFSDTTTSVIGGTGAMMKRPDETDSQFMAST